MAEQRQGDSSRLASDPLREAIKPAHTAPSFAADGRDAHQAGPGPRIPDIPRADSAKSSTPSSSALPGASPSSFPVSSPTPARPWASGVAPGVTPSIAVKAGPTAKPLIAMAEGVCVEQVAQEKTVISRRAAPAGSDIPPTPTSGVPGPTSQQGVQHGVQLADQKADQKADQIGNQIGNQDGVPHGARSDARSGARNDARSGAVSGLSVSRPTSVKTRSGSKAGGGYASDAGVEGVNHSAASLASGAGKAAGEGPIGSPADLGRRLEGQRLGHYLLEQFVGGGGMGAVFRATDTRLSRVVAVKVMARDRTDEDTLRRFQNEAQSAARLDHPNIARVYYVGEDAGLNFIVFEYIEGVNIRDYVLRRGPLPLEEAVNFTMQLAEALEHAHQRSVVHRDIKPSNVLVTGNGQLKLVDMGLARMHQVKASDAELTATGVTLGTFDYISPEQAKDPRSADVRSDLYSLGCTLFFMLTGRPPFPDGTVLQKLLSHSSEPPPSLLALRGDLDPELAELVEKLLAKQPSQRHQTPGELIGALLLIADRLGFDRLARTGVVVMAAPVGFWAFVERQLPWAAPCLLFLAVIAALRWGGNSEVGPAWVPLRPSYEPLAAAGLPTVPPTQLPAPIPSQPMSPAAGSAGERAKSAVPSNSVAPPDSVAPPNSVDPSDSVDPSNSVDPSDSVKPVDSVGPSKLSVPANSAAPNAAASAGTTDASNSSSAPRRGRVEDLSEGTGSSGRGDGQRQGDEATPSGTRVPAAPPSLPPSAPNSGAKLPAANSEPSAGLESSLDSRTVDTNTAGTTGPENASVAPRATGVALPTTPATSASEPTVTLPTPRGPTGIGGIPSGSVPSGGASTDAMSVAVSAAGTAVSPVVGNAASATRTDGSPGDMRRPTMGEMMEMASQSIRRVVVGAADGGALDPDTRRFDDLHDAFRAAVEWPSVESVELRYDGPRVTRPFDIALPSRRVTVRAGAGFRPKVVFRPEVSESVADRRMIRLRHCGLTWEGIPVELRLPDQPAEDWALFQLDRATRVELVDTVMTVREPAGLSGWPQAAAFLRFAEPVKAR